MVPTIPTDIQPTIYRLDRLVETSDTFSAFLDTDYPILLESALNTPHGRYSYITAEPFAVIRSKKNSVEICGTSRTRKLNGDPFHSVRQLISQYVITRHPGGPPFQGGAIGYFAYEMGRHIERLPLNTIDDLNLPEMVIGLYDWVLAIDHQANERWICATGLPSGTDEEAGKRIEWVKNRLYSHKPDSAIKMTNTSAAVSPRSNFTRCSYKTAVQTVKDYLAAGDVYQVNLSQRFQAETELDAWSLYRRLGKVSPAPFASYLGFPDATVISSSPEQFLKLDGDLVTTRPMKGTRPRGATPTEDAQLVEDLQTSPKDRAENVMIVDLLRNDLGKVCVPGSVQVSELFIAEMYPTVHQMVSEIRGQVDTSHDLIDVLRACFPGGSVTGAPKIRAMEIIDELEPIERSVYCGAIGYLGFDGSMQVSIPIRTLVMKDTRVFFSVGGGIVADSDPDDEYEETLHKASGIFGALGSNLA